MMRLKLHQGKCPRGIGRVFVAHALGDDPPRQACGLAMLPIKEIFPGTKE